MKHGQERLAEEGLDADAVLGLRMGILEWYELFPCECGARKPDGCVCDEEEK